MKCPFTKGKTDCDNSCSIYKTSGLCDLLLNNIRDGMISNNEIIAIKYSLACGCNWLAKDYTGKVYAYKNRPYRISDKHWISDGLMIEINIPIPSISWDDEPLNIRDLNL